MTVGILEVRIRLFASESLKDKRRVVKSLFSRLRSSFNVSVAELGDHALWQMVHFGIVHLSPDSVYSNHILDTIVEFLERQREFFVVDLRKELL
jgi:uncharacterized protein YlxP (DUF503 family)